MGIEIERKFLLAGDGWRAAETRSRRMVQGYLVDAAALSAGLARCTVRVRIASDEARLNIKAAQAGVERAEFEYPLPSGDAEWMLCELCGARLEKVRHDVEVDGHVFEVDEFLGDNRGLWVAELELPAVDAAFPRPAWLGREVSHLARYYNVNLAARPWSCWNGAERAGGEDDACC
jgi:adenylate cyclase